MMAMAGFDKQLNPLLLVSPKMQTQYGRPSGQPNVKRGDKFLAHEFGHLITGPGSKNAELARLLIELNPESIQTERGNEEFADDFQLAVEYLRSGGKRRVSKKAKQIADILSGFRPFMQPNTTTKR